MAPLDLSVVPCFHLWQGKPREEDQMQSTPIECKVGGGAEEPGVSLRTWALGGESSRAAVRNGWPSLGRAQPAMGNQGSSNTNAGGSTLTGRGESKPDDPQALTAGWEGQGMTESSSNSEPQQKGSGI